MRKPVSGCKTRGDTYQSVQSQKMAVTVYRIEFSDTESRVIDQPAAICKQQIFSHDAAHIDPISFD